MQLLYLLVYFIPLIWAVPALMEVIGYVQIMKKMGKSRLFGIIPFIAQCVLAKELLRRWASYWKTCFMVLSLYGLSVYIGHKTTYAKIIVFVAITIYNLMLVPLYYKLGKQFGKGFFFRIGLILMPALFLLILGFGKSQYQGRPDYDKGKVRPRWVIILRGIAYVLLSAAEVFVFATICFYITLITRPMRFITDVLLKDMYETSSQVKYSDECINRADELGNDYDTFMEQYKGREHYVNTENADNVVVMEYVIGSNLEDGIGSATLNLWQMRDATKGGDGLTFVVQAGGSQRWFADEIEDNTVGRYTIKEGKIERAQLLDETTCLSEPENLAAFIRWTKENYPADRYMLVFWDHGGGFSGGYGQDDLNEREGNDADDTILTVSEIVGAIKDAEMKFDLIGFDACLMQDIETANAMEPYADYYLASQESEPGTGWFYTEAFKKLAEDPAVSTEEFGKIAVSTFDQSLREFNEGVPDINSTLSLVDLAYVKPVAEKITDIYSAADELITDNPSVYIDIAAARSAAHHFESDASVDLADFVTELEKADFDDQILSAETTEDILGALRACVVCRNRDSVEGCNGLSIAFPYDDCSTYSYEYKQLKAFGYDEEESLFSKCLSIIVSQNESLQNGGDLNSFVTQFVQSYYTQQEWYVKGFEDYDSTPRFIDIPLIESEEGYRIDLPDNIWEIIVDSKVVVYLETDEGRIYLGRDYVGADDESGYPIISIGDSWVHINDRIVCYEAGDVVETEAGTVYKGSVKAKLNGKKDIILQIEWDPMSGEDSEKPGKGRIIGYYEDGDSNPFMRKGMEQLETGDTLEFMFYYYDDEGQYSKADSYDRKMTITSPELLVVEDKALSPATIDFMGVLTDVYKREFFTEQMTVSFE